MERVTGGVVSSNNKLYQLAQKRIPMFSVMNFERVARHGMIKQLVAVNLALYGLYCYGRGPERQLYREYLTLDANSSFLSLPFCHFGHTSMLTLAVNSGVLWTLGNSHIRTFGCSQFTIVAGMGLGLATVLGAARVAANPEQTISGCTGATSALVAYNLFKNPAWFATLRCNPMLLLAALTGYAVFNKDVACLGGIGGGYLALILAL